MARDGTHDGRRAAVVFFDLDALVVRDPGGRVRVRRTARAHLGAGTRVGILANAPRGLGRLGIEQTLVALGIDGFVDRDLVIDAAALPVPLPDGRAFAAAAAIAGTHLADSLFVTTRPVLAAAAAAAGMAVEGVGAATEAAIRARPGRRGTVRAPLGRRSGAGGRGGPVGRGVPVVRGGPVGRGGARGGAGRVDRADGALADVGVLSGLGTRGDGATGPTFVLRGRIVTMGRAGVVDGFLAVRAGMIAAIVRDRADLPAALRSAPVVETAGTIYPGLIDLHNHYVYNVAPLWHVPKQYHNRTAWSGDASKNAQVALPVRLLAGWSSTAMAIVRYVEAKGLIGGTTTGQGIRTQVQGGSSLFRGAMRNVEAGDDPRLPDSATLVPNLGRRPQDFDAFRASLQKRIDKGGSYFYHLAEGTDPLAERTFTDLRDNGLLLQTLVGIHSLGLSPADLHALAAAKAKAVWSPFSNLLLYGKTLDLAAVLRSRVHFAIGADWAPSGSRNLLFELKVARHVVRAQAARLTSRDLVRCVTARAAELADWSPYLGALRVGALADVLVVRGADGDPYDHLIDATEPDVVLVTVDGIPRYGDRAVMDSLAIDPGTLEAWSTGGVDKALQLVSAGSPLNGLTLAEAELRLRDALADLPAFLEVVRTGTSRLAALGVDGDAAFRLVLDNEADPEAATTRLDVAKVDWSLLPASLELDGLVVGGTSFWQRVAGQPNLDPALKDALRAAYPA